MAAKVIKLDDYRRRRDNVRPFVSVHRNIAEMLIIDEASDVPGRVWGGDLTIAKIRKASEFMRRNGVELKKD